MAQDEAKEKSVDDVMSLIGQLTPEQQEQLRRQLNDRAWRRRLRELSGSDFTRGALARWRRLIERMESGNIDDDIKQFGARGWQDFTGRLRAASSAFSGDIEPGGDDDSTNDLEKQLETVYRELQDNLIQVRHAVAQAIATEKQVQEQVQKNKEQAETWQNRAEQ